MNTTTKIMLAALLGFSATASAEVLDMVPFTTDVDGRTYMVEREFYDYGTKQNNFKYKGTRVWVVDQLGRKAETHEVYFDCSDNTYGFSIPTTEDLMKGTVIYQIYLKACSKN